jgi:hypothetical protein
MRSYKEIRKEYQNVCAKLKELEDRAKEKEWQGVLPEDEEQYFRAYEIKQTLEWVTPSLVKPEIRSYRHIVAGPLHALLYP